MLIFTIPPYVAIIWSCHPPSFFKIILSILYAILTIFLSSFIFLRLQIFLIKQTINELELPKPD